MPGTYNFEIERGADTSITVTWKDSLNNPINLTGFTGALNCLDMTLTNGDGLTLGGAAGTIAIVVDAERSRLLDGNPRYELDLTSGTGETTRLLKGRIRVNHEVAP